MSRSVSTHRHAVATVYLHMEVQEDYEWQDFIDDVRNVITDKFNDFYEVDRWSGREDHVVLESLDAEVSVSEYNGIVAICLAPRSYTDHDDEEISADFRVEWQSHLYQVYKSCALISNGRASNGEQFFTPTANPESCVTSKEGTLW